MAGVWHGDLRERNVIKGHRGLRIVDFSHAELHDCPGPDCDELDLLRIALGIGQSRFPFLRLPFGLLTVSGL
jgi:tRNA A-37 threonylcarbamoyl transferase component Bud32